MFSKTLQEVVGQQFSTTIFNLEQQFSITNLGTLLFHEWTVRALWEFSGRVMDD